MPICRFCSDHISFFMSYDSSVVKIKHLMEEEKMVVILLIIIACCLLFGKEATKNGIGNIISFICILCLIASLASCMGCLD